MHLVWGHEDIIASAREPSEYDIAREDGGWCPTKTYICGYEPHVSYRFKVVLVSRWEDVDRGSSIKSSLAIAP